MGNRERIRYQHSSLARRVQRRINPWLLRLTTHRSAGIEQTLVVAGSPRSGTTWLAELVSALPGAAVLFEPLQSNEVPEARQCGFHRGTCLVPGQVDDAKQQYLERALRGEVRNAWTVSRISLWEAARHRFWIVKFVHANLLLGWLCERFPVRPPALIIRHPCSVVASQLKMWQAHCWREEELQEVLALRPEFRPLVEGLQTPAQRLAALWCIEQSGPLSLPRPWPFRLVCYERLVRGGADELERLLTGWELPLTAAAVERLGVASTTTQRDSHLLRRGDPLAAWRKKLNRSQIAEILEVVAAFGLDFYSEELEPDYERLEGMGDGLHRVPSSTPPSARLRDSA